MSFREAIKVCFQKYFTFSGRARRTEYWSFALFCFLVSIILHFLDKFLFDKGIYIPVTIFGKSYAIGLENIFYLGVLIPSLAVTVRRLHDIGKSGWLYLPLFIIGLFLPFIDEIWLMNLGMDSALGIAAWVVLLLTLAYAILMVVWLFRDSESDANRWGWNPKF